MKDLETWCSGAGLPQVSFADDEVLLAENERTGKLLVLESGSVRVTRDDVEIARISRPGAVFGEVAVLLDRPHTATVRSLGDSTCHLIEEGASFLRDHPDFHVHVSRLLAHRLAALTGYLVDLKQQFQSREDHLGMVDEVLEGIAHSQPRRG